MNKFYVALSLIGIVICSSIIFWPEPQPQLPITGSTIVVFGDSLAKGVGSSAGNDIANLIAKSVTYPVINLGVSGDTTASGLVRIDEVIQANPRVVVILLGGNDALQRVPIETTFANLSLIIERIQAHGAAIILVGVPGGLYGNRYEREYAQLAKKYRTFYVSNILSGLLGQAAYMSDYIHPNDAGYIQATSRILPEIEKALAGGA